MACVSRVPFQSVTVTLARLQTGADQYTPRFVPRFAPSVCITPTSTRFQAKFLRPSIIRAQGTAGRTKQKSRNAYLSVDISETSFVNDSIHGQLPPLVSSLVIDGISLRRENMHVAAAEERLMKIAMRSWPNSSFGSRFMTYCRIALSLCAFYFPEAELDRLVALTTVIGTLFLIDDVVDAPTDLQLLEECGIDRSVRESLPQMWEFLSNLDELLRRDEPLCDPCTPIQRIIWEAGQDLQRLSTPGWLNYFVDALLEHHRVSFASRADFASDGLTLQELEHYIEMRLWDVAGLFTGISVEFASDDFLSDDVREHPFTVELTNAAVTHGMLVNDIFSYPKEVNESDNPCNVISMLMVKEKIPLPRAAWRSIELANSYHRAFMEVENLLLVWEPKQGSQQSLRRYLGRLRDVYSGNVYWSSLTKRYRTPDSVFPELRGNPKAHEQLRAEVEVNQN